MGFTVDQAVAYVRKKLNTDSSSTEWSASEITDALEGAMAQTIEDYVDKGGDALNEYLSLTSDANGLVDLSTYNCVRIFGAQVQQGQDFYSLPAALPSGQIYKDEVARDVRLKVVRGYTPSATGSDPLLNGGGARNAITLERLICLRAVEELLIDDAAAVRALERTLARYEKSAFKFKGVQGANILNGGKKITTGNLFNNRAWSYDPATESLQIWRTIR